MAEREQGWRRIRDGFGVGAADLYRSIQREQEDVEAHGALGESPYGPRLGLIVHHTDAAREVAYDCDSHIGRLCDGLENGPGLGWLIVDMAEDWARIYTGAR